jgi:hypothetical protein
LTPLDRDMPSFVGPQWDWVLRSQSVVPGMSVPRLLGTAQRRVRSAVGPPRHGRHPSLTPGMPRLGNPGRVGSVWKLTPATFPACLPAREVRLRRAIADFDPPSRATGPRSTRAASRRRRPLDGQSGRRPGQGSAGGGTRRRRMVCADPPSGEPDDRTCAGHDSVVGAAVSDGPRRGQPCLGAAPGRRRSLGLSVATQRTYVEASPACRYPIPTARHPRSCQVWISSWRPPGTRPAPS